MELTIKERAEQIAGWILRREGSLKAARLPLLIEDAIAEQKKIDIKKAISLLDCIDVDKLYAEAEVHPEYGRIPNKDWIKLFRETMELED